MHESIQFVKHLVYAIILLMLVDALYLLSTKNLILSTTKRITGGNSYTKRYYSAIIVYIGIAIALLVLVMPKISHGNWYQRLKDSLIWGGLFGMCSYAIFDFTMHFMFNDWTLQLALMDTIWGGLLCTIVAFLMSYLV